MELPLTHRELLRLSRRRGFYASRMIAPAWSALLMTAATMSLTPVRPETVGAGCYYAALIAQFFAVYGAVPVVMADTIAREKDEQTLAVLLLANPRSHDIILSKFAAPVVFAVLLIAGSLPMMAFAGFFGAVPPAQATWQTLLSAVTAVAVGSLALLASVVASRPRHALGIAYTFIGGLMLMAEILHRADPTRHWSPWRWVVADRATDPLERLAPLLVISFAITTLALVAAIEILPRQFERSSGLRRHRRRHRHPKPPRVLDESSDRPLYDLLRYSGLDDRTWGWRPLRAMFWLAIFAVMVAVGPFAGVVLILLVVYQSHTAVSALARNGALDDLRLATPDGRSLADALFQRQFRVQLLAVPAYSVASAWQAFDESLFSTCVTLACEFAVGVAVVRFSVGYACAHWHEHTTWRVALIVLWRVFVRLLGSLFIGVCITILAAVITLGIDDVHLYLFYVVANAFFIGILVSDSGTELLRFKQRIEGQFHHA